MSVAIRLSRRGATHSPFYSIVVANSTSPRDGKFIQKVGTYDPMLLNISRDARAELKGDDKVRASCKFDRDTVIKWLNNGAQPTERVATLLAKHGVDHSLISKHLRKIESSMAIHKTKKDLEAKKAAAEAAASEDGTGAE